jgi:hypothetical protein
MTHILSWLIMNLQCSLILIQYTVENLVQDHLTQFILDDLYSLADLLSDPAKLD